MLDIQQLRKELPTVVAGLARRGVVFDEQTFRSLEDHRKQLQIKTEELQAKRNAASKQIGILKGKGEDTGSVMVEVSGLGEELKANETALADLQQRLTDFLRTLPNIPRADVPQGNPRRKTSKCANGAPHAHSISRRRITSILVRRWRASISKPPRS